jgi:HAD superfamily hydrolase (TIGR01509 family)
MNDRWTKFLVESKLRVFDFDDTLVKTDAMIKVTDPKGKTHTMTPGEFAEHEIDKESQYDFAEFEQANLINPREIEKVTKVLRNVVDAGGEREVVILTARTPSAQDSIEDYLEDIGIDSSKINIILVGDPDPAAKANWIENKIVDGATDILFLDDSGQNVDAVLGLKNKYPNIKIDARVVNYAEEIAEGVIS